MKRIVAEASRRPCISEAGVGVEGSGFKVSLLFPPFYWELLVVGGNDSLLIHNRNA